MSHPDEFGIPEQDEAIQDVARDLVAEAPEGWQKIVFTYAAIVGMSTSTFTSTLDNNETKADFPPIATNTKMRKLREDMYSPESGTWFTATVTVDNTGKYHTQFDYDSEPDFNRPLTAGAYQLDFEEYPRPSDQVPSWLRDKLDASPDSV